MSKPVLDIIFRMVKRRRELNRIKQALDEKGKTQAWLAGELDMEFRTISRYVNNHRQPSIETLFAIARALEVNPKDLINS